MGVCPVAREAILMVVLGMHGPESGGRKEVLGEI